jgi:hypothetical protein
MTRGISAESSSSGLEGKGDAAMVSGCPAPGFPQPGTEQQDLQHVPGTLSVVWLD